MAKSKAARLTLADEDFAYVAVLQVAKKGDDDLAARFVSSFWDRVGADEVHLRRDGEISLAHLVQKVKAFRRPGQTMLEAAARGEHEPAWGS